MGAKPPNLCEPPFRSKKKTLRDIFLSRGRADVNVTDWVYHLATKETLRPTLYIRIKKDFLDPKFDSQVRRHELCDMHMVTNAHPCKKAFQQVYVRTAPPPDKNLKVSVMNSLKPCSNYSAVWLRREPYRVDKRTVITLSRRSFPLSKQCWEHRLMFFTDCKTFAPWRYARHSDSHTHMRFGLISAQNSTVQSLWCDLRKYL